MIPFIAITSFLVTVGIVVSFNVLPPNILIFVSGREGPLGGVVKKTGSLDGVRGVVPAESLYRVLFESGHGSGGVCNYREEDCY